MSVQQMVTELIQRDRVCHYCKNPVNRLKDHSKSGTREHVLPKCYGGSDLISNLVLACRSCNNKRGNSLFYCTCDFCSSIIDKAIRDKDIMNDIAWGIFQHSRVKVYRDLRSKEKVWTVRHGYNHKHFHTHAQALEYALIGDFKVRRKHGIASRND